MGRGKACPYMTNGQVQDLLLHDKWAGARPAPTSQMGRGKACPYVTNGQAQDLHYIRLFRHNFIFELQL